MTGAMAPGELRIKSVRHASTVVLTSTGEIDTATAPQMLAAADVALAGHPAVLILDLAGVSFLASAGLTAMVAIQRQAAPNVVVRVVASTRTTLRPLQITQLDQQLPIFPSLEAALNADDTNEKITPA
jgi:anti-sigma B factor antagonist